MGIKGRMDKPQPDQIDIAWRRELGVGNQPILSDGQKHLVEIWKAQKKGNDLPMWTSEQLLESPDLVPELMVLRLNNNNGLDIIYHGTKSIERIGEDYTGTDYFNSSRAAQREGILSGANHILSVPCASLSDYQIVQRQWKDFYYTITTFSLPFCDTNGNPTIVQNYISVIENDAPPRQMLDPGGSPDDPLKRIDQKSKPLYFDLGFGLP